MFVIETEKKAMTKGIHKDFAAWLLEQKALSVRFDEPMSRHTTLGVGGPADAFVIAGSKRALKELVQKARQFACSWQMLGGGSNVLVGDKGVPGLVIKLGKGFGRIRPLGPESVFAGAAARTASLCRYAIKHGFNGFQFLAGIPGSVGGAVSGNSGTALGHAGEIVREVWTMDSLGAERKVSGSQISWGYRSMNLPQGFAHKPVIILGAAFGFSPAQEEQNLEREYRLLLEGRKKTQPWGPGLAGCFFKNPPGLFSAGALIDRAGLKGFSVGDATVSPVHANFLVNRGKASAADFLLLMEKVADKVRRQSGVSLEPEVKVLS